MNRNVHFSRVAGLSMFCGVFFCGAWDYILWGGVCNSPMPPPPQGIAGNQAGGVTPSSNLCIANSRRYINPKVESDNRHLDTQEKMDRIGGEKQAVGEKLWIELVYL